MQLVDNVTNADQANWGWEGNSNNVVPLLKMIHCDCAVVTIYFDPLADKVDLTSHTRMWVMLKWPM